MKNIVFALLLIVGLPALADTKHYAFGPSIPADLQIAPGTRYDKDAPSRKALGEMFKLAFYETNTCGAKKSVSTFHRIAKIRITAYSTSTLGAMLVRDAKLYSSAKGKPDFDLESSKSMNQGQQTSGSNRITMLANGQSAEFTPSSAHVSAGAYFVFEGFKNNDASVIVDIDFEDVVAPDTVCSSIERIIVKDTLPPPSTGGSSGGGGGYGGGTTTCAGGICTGPGGTTVCSGGVCSGPGGTTVCSGGVCTGPGGTTVCSGGICTGPGGTTICSGGVCTGPDGGIACGGAGACY